MHAMPGMGGSMPQGMGPRTEMYVKGAAGKAAKRKKRKPKKKAKKC